MIPIATILGLNPGVQGMNYHDPSACILVDGKIVAASEEERFNRQKGSPGLFPTRAVEWCLTSAGCKMEDIDVVSVGYDVSKWPERIQYLLTHVRKPGPASLRGLSANCLQWANELQLYAPHSSALYIKALLDASATKMSVEFIPHHIAHAYSAFTCSGFAEALILIADGVGELASTSVWLAKDSSLTLLWETDVCNSLGYFYAGITEFLGFQAWEGEGKTMALAAYGDYDAELYEKMGHIVEISSPGYKIGTILADSLKDGSLALDKNKILPRISEMLGIEPRTSKAPLKQVHFDVARAAQHALEEAVITLAKAFLESTGMKALCTAGGVFLNCQINMRLSRCVPAFFAQPVAKDSGVALGAAIASAVQRGERVSTHLELGLGPRYTQQSIVNILNDLKIPFEIPRDLPAFLARTMQDGNVICWFEGGAEYGPRALGHRSIFADPRDPSMKETLNNIKGRELWRPFGPSILQERCEQLLVGYSGQDLYMIQAFCLRDSWSHKIPAVVHADGTTRPHSVSVHKQPLLHAVIQQFEKLTGIPALINTSFNGPGEPIVCTPVDAIRMFYSCGADILVMEGVVIYGKGGERTRCQP